MSKYIKGYKKDGKPTVGIFNEGENTPIVEKAVESEEQLIKVINEWEKRHPKQEEIISVAPNKTNEIDHSYEDIKVDRFGNVIKLQRNNNFKQIVSTTLGVALGLALIGGTVFGLYKGGSALINKIKKDNSKKTEETKETSYNDVDSKIVVDNDTSSSKITDELKEYTKEEKQEFIKNNVSNFTNEIASLTGITLTNNEALIQLGFINGLAPQDINVETDNYWLSFANDYNAILDEITIPTINYLSFDKKLKGSNPESEESIYKNYILDEKDKRIYAYYADNMQYIVNSAYESDKGNALDTSYQFNRSIAETLVYPNNPVQKDQVKAYLTAKQQLIDKFNKVPTYEEIASYMNLTVYNVKELEIASLGVDTASKEIYFMVTLVSQKTVQMLPQDTLISYVNTLGDLVDENSSKDEQIMNYNAKHGNPNNTNDENYMHSKYLLQDIEYYMENTITNILAEYEENGMLCNEKTEENKCCSVSHPYNNNKKYVKTLKNYQSMKSYL